MNVGVILDFSTTTGLASNACISIALHDFFEAANTNTIALELHIRDSRNNVLQAASAAVDLIQNMEVKAILGPMHSSEAEFITKLGDETHVPIISFTTTSPTISPSTTPFFVRTAQSDCSQVGALVAIMNNYRWREAVLINEDTEFGRGMIPCLIDALQNISVSVPYRSILPSSLPIDLDLIRMELYKIMTMQTRVFIVHALLTLGTTLFSIAKELGMMSEGYVWIITNGIGNPLDTLNKTEMNPMDGVLGVRTYLPPSPRLDDFKSRWARDPNLKELQLNAFDLWAYDTAQALAMSANSTSTNIGLDGRKNNLSSGNLTSLNDLGISRSGSDLLQSILRTNFVGLTGDFHLVAGELISNGYEIVNIVGTGERVVGYWSPNRGLTKTLVGENDTDNSSSRLKAVVWPGDSTIVPKGWVWPTSGKKLKIGVPVKDDKNNAFVIVDMSSNSTREPIVKGYSIDVFKAVMEALPYALPYEFVPFANSNGESAGTYDDLVRQIYLQNYDAVVGDVTIVSQRMNFVDFSMPYTDSGVTAVMPLINGQDNNALAFTKPFTLELWMVIGASFFFTGIVVWILEHKVNPEFRGPPKEQIGLLLYFIFSTMTFSQREGLASNLTRFVVIVWLFVVLILASSYTASLTSILTVQQLQTPANDILSLAKNDEYICYQTGSFVIDLLNNMGINANKIRALSYMDQYYEALTNGSKNGGCGAIVDEIPYLKGFLSKYCNQFAMVGPIYKTAGFGFAFPIGSPLVSDVSRAVLNVTQSDTMNTIEKAWFGDLTSCPSSSGSGSTIRNSGSLPLSSFSVLFTITVSASIGALTIFIISFLYEYSQNHTLREARTSFWQKMNSLVRHFDEKDLSSHNFKKMNLGNTPPPPDPPTTTTPQTFDDHHNLLGTSRMSSSTSCRF